MKKAEFERLMGLRNHIQERIEIASMEAYDRWKESYTIESINNGIEIRIFPKMEIVLEDMLTLRTLLECPQNVSIVKDGDTEKVGFAIVLIPADYGWLTVPLHRIDAFKRIYDSAIFRVLQNPDHSKSFSIVIPMSEVQDNLEIFTREFTNLMARDGWLATITTSTLGNDAAFNIALT